MRIKITILSLLLILVGPLSANAKFGSRKRNKITKNAVNITTRGAILLNKVVGVKYLKGCKFVNVRYLPTSKTLIIKPVRVPGKHSIRVHRARKGKVIIILKKNLLKRIGAKVSGKTYFGCKWDASKKVIRIDYTKPVTRSTLE